MSTFEQIRAELNRKYGNPKQDAGNEPEGSFAAIRQRLLNKYGSAPTEPVVFPRDMKKTEQSPIKQITPSQSATEQEDKEKWYEGWLSGGGFKDSYQFGDITRTAAGTSKDIRESLYGGVIGLAEPTIDTGAYLVGEVGSLFGGDKFRENIQDFIARDIINEEKIAKGMDNLTGGAIPGGGLITEAIMGGEDADDYSLLGKKADSVLQSGGQLAGQGALQSLAKVPWWVTSGVSSFGGEVENAFNQGATSSEAGVSDLISAGAEILTEKISGGIKFGGKTLDDAVKPLIERISKKAIQTAVNLGLDIAGEGAEEVLSGLASALGQKLTYASEKDFKELYSSDDAWTDFISGALLSGVSSGAKAFSASMNRRKGTEDQQSGEASGPAEMQESSQVASENPQQHGGVDIPAKTGKRSQPVQSAVDEFRKSGVVSNRTATAILNDPQALEQLTQETGITLPDTNSGKRNAVKDAVAKLAQAEQWDYGISDNGKAINTKTNQTVELQGFAEGNKGMSIKTDSGTAAREDIAYADEDQAVVYESILNLGIRDADYANALLNLYRDDPDSVSAGDFVNGMVDAFVYGQHGMDVSDLAENATIAKATPVQRNSSLYIGKKFAGKQTATAEAIARQNRIRYGKVRPRIIHRKGVVKGYDVSINALNKAFNSTQRKAYEILTTIAEVTGIDIVLYKSAVDSNGNLVGGVVDGIDMSKAQGAFSFHNDKIYIDINAGLIKGTEMEDVAKYSMLRTFTHEFVHFVEKWNASEHVNLQNAVFDTMRKNGIDPDELIDIRMGENDKLSREQAAKEVVAEALTDILPQSKFVEKLANKHRNLFRKLLDKLKEFTARIKDYFAAIGTTISKETAAVKECIDGMERYADELVEMFDQIAMQAVKNYQVAKTAQKNTATKGGVQYQTRSVDGNQVVWVEDNILKDNQGQPVHQYIADYIAEHIGEVYTIIESGQKVYLGEDLPGEYTQSKYTQAVLRNNPNIVKAKNRASANLGEMIEIATNRRWEKTKHGHSKDAQFGIYRYDTRFGFPRKNSRGDVIGANIYKAELLIRNASDGKKYLYDIVNIKKDTASSDWLSQRVTSAAGKSAGQKGNVSENSIRSGGQNVNSNSSGEQHQDRTGTLTNRDIITEIDGKTELERAKLKEYQEKLDYSREQSRILAEKNEQISELSGSNDPKSKEKIRELRLEAQKAKNRRDIAEEQLRRMENGVLAPLIEREKGRVLEKLRQEYGTIPKGEKAVRDDGLPVSTDGSNKVSRTARTVKGAGVTPDDFAELIDTEVAKGGLTYIPITNSETVQKAAKHIEEVGWEAAKIEWSTAVRSGKVGAELSATGALLLNNAAQAGDKNTWLDILHDYQYMGTNAGQGMQAFQILKQLQPQDELYAIKRSLNHMIEDMHLDLKLDENLEKQYMEAKTDAERDKILKKIKKSLAKQIPVTLLDKWTALRYLNMLGNLRTQVRNIIGNAGMTAVTSFKNLTAIGLERIAYKASGGKFKRTKSAWVSKDMLDAANADFKLVESVVQDGGKYSDNRTESAEFAKSVMAERTIFKWQLLEKYRTTTNLLMEKGDLLFSKAAYARALAGYLKANGVRTSDFSKVDVELMNKARLYAVQEAQEQTFHDTNVLSGWLAKVGRRKDTPAAVKAISEGTVPFRKTAANILVRAEEYSPLGIVNSAYTSIRAMQKDSEVTGAQVVNSWAKSLTGTGLFALGALLYSAGALIGGPDDDEKLDDFEALYGQQNYALKLGDVYVTIDFLSPASIPMFMGAQFWKLVQENGFQAKDIEEALTAIADPMIQMSMLQGVNDTLENIQYAENNLMQMGINAAVSYLTQGVTNSFIGQLERSFEDRRMSTYVDKDGVLPDWLQRTVGKATAKIPGLDYNQIPYINAWGEAEENPPIWLNTAYNTLSPAYISKGAEDAVYKELARLNDAQGDVNVFPSTPEKTFKYNNEERNLSAEEYVELAKLQGQTQRKIVEKMVGAKLYKELPDQYKAKAIEFAYKYAREHAQIEVLDRNGFSSDWMAEIKGDTAEGILKHVVAENIKGMYLDGHITAGEAVKRLVKYEGRDETEAAEKVACWDFREDHPEYSDWSDSTITRFKEMDVKSAAHVIGLLDGLKPESGYTNVRPVQKIEAIVNDSDLSNRDKDAALRALMDDKLEEKYDAARDMGIGMNDFVQAYRKYQDTSGKSKKKTVVNYYVKSFGLSKTEAEKLYDLFAGRK